MNNILSDDRRILHVLQNVPVAIHACCINERRKDENAPCTCCNTVVNDALSYLTGYTRRDISLKFNDQISQMVIPEDRGEYLAAIDELYEFPHEKELTFRVRKKNGEIIEIRQKICSVRQADGSVWLYAISKEDQQEPMSGMAPGAEAQSSGRRVSIRTFGYFNVLIDGQPVAFQHEKAKELLALLVDRQGKYVSASEIISCLWEDEPVNDNTRGRCRKAVFYLKETLAQYGLEELIESTSKGYRRIRTELIDCDLFRYLNGEPAYVRAFRGAYMTDYSWAEATLTSLMYAK